jgi:hypothetical protein
MTPTLRSARLDGLKNIACAVAVTLPFGAGAVMAASEALQPAGGRAVVMRCEAIGGCQVPVDPPAPRRIARLDAV